MRRFAIVAVCCAAFQLLTASPAHAWWGWWDEMSGPGPWMFFDVQYRVVCLPTKKVDEVPAGERNPAPDVLRTISSFDGTGRRILAAVSGAGCLTNFKARPGRASINFSPAVLHAVRNTLKGQGGPDSLFMKKLEATASVFLDSRKVVELYAGGGVVKGFHDTDFTRGYWTVTTTISPYAMLPRDTETHRYLRTITINAGVIFVPNGFAAADFGSRGPFRTDREFLKTISVALDFSKF
jgi:hypothetical protein